MIALIIGATGATGKELVNQILQDDDFTEVHTFGRKPLEIENFKLKNHVVDFDHPDEWKELVKGDVAFSCLGTTLKAAGTKENQYKIDVDYQFNFAQIAAKNGVRQFVLVSSYGADPKSKMFYPRMKGELEQKVKQLPFEQITYFQPGMLDRENSERFGERLGVKAINFLNGLGILKTYRPLPTATLAKAMINAAKIKSNGFSEIKMANIFNFANK